MHSGYSVNTDITDSRLLVMGSVECIGVFGESFDLSVRPHRQLILINLDFFLNVDMPYLSH